MNGLIQRREFAIFTHSTQRCRRQHTQAACQHGCKIRQQITKQVAGHNHIKLARVTHHLHGAVISQHVREFHIREFFSMHVCNHFLPQKAAFHDIAFFNRAHTVRPLACQIKRHTCYTLDFCRGVNFCVDAALAAIRQGFNATWVTKIDTTHRFTHDHDIQTTHHIRLKRAGIYQCIKNFGGAQIGKQPQFLPQLENGHFRALFKPDMRPLRITYRAKQHSIRSPCLLNHFITDRHTVFCQRSTTNHIFCNIEGQATAAFQPINNVPDFPHDFGANTVTRQNKKFYGCVLCSHHAAPE